MTKHSSAGSGRRPTEGSIPHSRGRRVSVRAGAATTSVRSSADLRSLPDPMRELRARALLLHLRGPHFQGVLNLSRQTFEILGRHGLNRAWVTQSANALVRDGLVTAAINDGAVTLWITEAGREASW